MKEKALITLFFTLINIPFTNAQYITDYDVDRIAGSVVKAQKDAAEEAARIEQARVEAATPQNQLKRLRQQWVDYANGTLPGVPAPNNMQRENALYQIRKIDSQLQNL